MRVHRVQTVQRGQRVMSIKSALRDLLSVSYDIVSILVISRYAAPPYPAAPDFHLKVKRLTMICASLMLLQIMFAVHPRECVSHDSQVALLPMNRVPLPPHSGDRINRSMLSCRDMVPWLSIHSPTACGGKGTGFIGSPATRESSETPSSVASMHFPRAKPGCTVFAAPGSDI